MTTRIGEPISLDTRHGTVRLRYFQYGPKEGVALISLKPFPDPTPVRVQSSCLFSESFWATDCDCAAQLQKAIKTIVDEGGVVVYIYEEGRGAGLRAKIEAIRLQQESGYDTRRAYECLQLDPDSRSYDAAAVVLKELLPRGRAVELLTNNPHKFKRLEELGIRVSRRRPLLCLDEGPAVRDYLEEKQRVLGHNLSEVADFEDNEEKS